MTTASKNIHIYRRLFREAFFMALIQILVASPSAAQRNHKKVQPAAVQIQFSDKEILHQSQISYRAEGGFTGVTSYGVILSCVDGKVSVLKSLNDPKLTNRNHKMIELKTMDKEQYLNLWNTLQRMNVFVTQNAPDPKLDILDEFTFTFNIKAGDREHQFRVYGINRPESSRHFAFKNVIDKFSDMNSFWNSHQSIARNPR